MKSPLVYLTATKLKNQLIAVVKSPAKLIYAVILVALFALTAFSGSAYDLEELRNPQELTAIMVLFYTMMFLMVFASGSSSSNSPMFTLSDVTLLFPAPMSSNKILVYGLVRQLGLSLVLGFFILFQYSWMHGAYGIGPAGLVLIIVGYAITLFFAQLASMASYVRTSGMERAGKTVRYCVFGAAALYGVWAVFSCREDLLALSNGGSYGPLLEKGAAFFATIPGILFPVSGWAAGLVSRRLAAGWPFRGAAGSPVRPAAGAYPHLQKQLLRGCALYRGNRPVRRHRPKGRPAQRGGAQEREGGQNRPGQGLGRLCYLLQAPGGKPPQRGVPLLQHVPYFHGGDYRLLLLYAGRGAGGHLCLRHLYAAVQRGPGPV